MEGESNRQRCQRLRREHGDEIAAEYAAGATLAQIGEKWSMTAMTVRAIVRANGVPMRESGNAGKGPAMKTARQIRLEHADEMRRMYEDDRKTLKEVGDRFGVSISVARQAVKDAGGTPRKRGYGSLPERNLLGENNPGWKGGTTIKDGYRMVRVDPDHWAQSMRRGSYVPEHRLVMAELLGRVLRPDESVHHINGDRTDNRPENLQLRQGQHGNGIHMRCRACGSFDVVGAVLA